MDRRREKGTLIYGTHSLIEAIESGTHIEKILIAKNLPNEKISKLNLLIQKHQIPVSRVPLDKLKGIRGRANQSVIAYVSPIEYVDVNEIIQSHFEKGENPRVLILDGLTDVRNVGAIIRSAACFGFHLVIIPTRGAAQISSDMVKTSSGAIFKIPIARTENVLETVKNMQASGLKVVCCTEKGTKEMGTVDFKEPFAIVMGSEETGIQAPILGRCDEHAKIYMYGEIDSLNVSVAAGVVMYESSLALGS